MAYQHPLLEGESRGTVTSSAVGLMLYVHAYCFQPLRTLLPLPLPEHVPVRASEWPATS